MLKFATREIQPPGPHLSGCDRTFFAFVHGAAIEVLPFVQPVFDLIVASSVCAFVPDYQQTLSDLQLLLKEDGVFVQWDWRSVFAHEQKRYDAGANGNSW